MTEPNGLDRLREQAGQAKPVQTIGKLAEKARTSLPVSDDGLSFYRCSRCGEGDRRQEQYTGMGKGYCQKCVDSHESLNVNMEAAIEKWAEGWAPKKYRQYRISHFPAAVQDKVPNELESVRFIGPTGTGKTSLCVAYLKMFGDGPILRAWHNKDWAVVRPHFCTAYEILLDIRATFNNPDRHAENERECVDRYSGYSVLVIDDIGAEQSTEFAQAALLAILDARMRDCLVTLVTTNYTLSEIAARDPRLASRLSEFKAVDLTGQPDRRVEMAKGRKA